jgi:hypothetical protein
MNDGVNWGCGQNMWPFMETSVDSNYPILEARLCKEQNMDLGALSFDLYVLEDNITPCSVSDIWISLEFIL